jgi:hypothetical protein
MAIAAGRRAKAESPRPKAIANAVLRSAREPPGLGPPMNTRAAAHSPTSRQPEARLSGWPPSAMSTTTSVIAPIGRNADGSLRISSYAKSAQGQKHATAVCGKSRRSVNESEKLKEIAAKSAPPRLAPHSLAHNHIPVAARNRRAMASQVSDLASGRRNETIVNGE